MNNLARNGNRGFLIIETMISLAIAAIILVSFDLLINQSIKTSRANEEEFRANLYLREGIEIAKDLELTNWDELGNCIDFCHPTSNSNEWEFDGYEEGLDSDFYKRKIYINDSDSPDLPVNVERKLVRVEICWQENCPADLSEHFSKYLETYVYHEEAP